MSVVLVILFVMASTMAVGCAVSRPRFLPVFLLAAGTLRLGADDVAGAMNLSALWLGAMILAAAIGILRLWRPGWRFSTPELLYLAFLGWCVFEAFQGPSAGFAARNLLKLAFPFLVLVLGRQVAYSGAEFRRLLEVVLAASFVASLFVGGATQRLFPALCWGVGQDVFWACAAFADHASIVLGLALIAWRMTGRGKYLALAAWLAASSVLAGVRTGVAATGIAASVFVWMTFRRNVAVPLLGAVYLAAAVCLFVLPEMKAYMFRDAADVDSGQIVAQPLALSLENVDDHGRFAMWAEVLDKFWVPNPVCGSGLGAVQEWFYSGEYGGQRVEHSGYVRFLGEIGFVGLALYLAAVLGAMLAAMRSYRSGMSFEVRLCALACLCAFPAMLICMGFDNIVNYVLPAGQFPFALAGIALGMAHRDRVRRPRHAQPSLRNRQDRATVRPATLGARR